jgi:hypothetical protein
LDFEASDSSQPGDAMAKGHLLKQIDFDVLLKMVGKNLCAFVGEEVGFKLYAPAADGEEDREDQFAILFSFKGIFVSTPKIIYENMKYTPGF